MLNQTLREFFITCWQMEQSYCTARRMNESEETIVGRVNKKLLQLRIRTGSGSDRLKAQAENREHSAILTTTVEFRGMKYVTNQSNHIQIGSGGLRYASTPGYFLATLRVKNRVDSSRMSLPNLGPLATAPGSDAPTLETRGRQTTSKPSILSAVTTI